MTQRDPVARHAQMLGMSLVEREIAIINGVLARQVADGRKRFKVATAGLTATQL